MRGAILILAAAAWASVAADVAAAAFLPPPPVTHRRFHHRLRSSSSSSPARGLDVDVVPTAAPTGVVSWERLGQLVEAALSVSEDEDELPRGAASASAADVALVEALNGMKAAATGGQQGQGQGQGLRFFNSVRMEPYRASKADLAVYARMQSKLETALGFTASPAVERIEAGIGIVMVATVITSITSLDKLVGVVPDIVRWVITAALVSLPFAYIVVGVALPDALIAAVNQVLFALNREYKERVFRHEAGHFLAGYLVGLPVLRYSVSGRLSAVQFALVLDLPLSSSSTAAGAAAATAPVGPLPREQADRMTPRGLLSKDELAKLAVVSLAGVVSEYVRFGKAEGGFTDLVQLQALLDLAGEMPEKESEGLINWAVIQAYGLVKQNEKALVALMAALERKARVVECMQIIERLGGKYLDDDDDDDEA